MGYNLRIASPGRDSERPFLSLSVWEMSKIRDRMLEAGAAHCASPPDGPFELSARCLDGTPGIPAYKLAMIDGWLVRQDEVREALSILDWGGTWGLDDGTWKGWIDFLQDAASGGGFFVE